MPEIPKASSVSRSDAYEDSHAPRKPSCQEPRPQELRKNCIVHRKCCDPVLRLLQAAYPPALSGRVLDKGRPKGSPSGLCQATLCRTVEGRQDAYMGIEQASPQLVESPVPTYHKVLICHPKNGLHPRPKKPTAPGSLKLSEGLSKGFSMIHASSDPPQPLVNIPESTTGLNAPNHPPPPKRFQKTSLTNLSEHQQNSGTTS